MASNKLLVFADPGYPGTSSPSMLARLIPGEHELVSAAELGEALQSASYSLLISFHGAYFPKEAWPQIVHYLENGGNLAVFGGMPFTRPVRPDGSIEIEQQAYCSELCLGPHFPLQIPEGSKLQLAAAEKAAFLAHHALTLSPSQTDHFWSFYPKLTQLSYDPQEMGAVGPFDTLLTPLLYLDEQDAIDATHLATLATLLDQQSGRFAGGRWLLSPWLPETAEDWLELAPVLHDLLHLTGKGATVIQVRPLLASYQPGETPTIAISSRSRSAHHAQIVVRSPQQESIASFDVELQGSSSLQEARFQLPSISTPGLYTIETLFRDEQDVVMRSQSGFWIWDEELVASCASLRLERGRDFFFCNGEPFPLFGTTYMDSKVQRKFLALPNPAHWDADFATFQKAGVNVIRTGIWTGWRELMPQVGDTNEQMLRALDAFVLTACRYRIQVIFTFFSFFPPLFEGINPWLDPRSLSGQKDLITALARPDGSAKPELGVMYEIGRLIQKLSGQLYEIETPPNIWVVIPYDQWFLRPALAIEPIRQAIRVLGYDLGLIPQVVGQHQLVEPLERYQPKTIILPALQYFEDASWQALMTFVERGSTLLVSGVIGRDQHHTTGIPTGNTNGKQTSKAREFTPRDQTSTQ